MMTEIVQMCNIHLSYMNIATAQKELISDRIWLIFGSPYILEPKKQYFENMRADKILDVRVAQLKETDLAAQKYSHREHGSSWLTVGYPNRSCITACDV